MKNLWLPAFVLTLYLALFLTPPAVYKVTAASRGESPASATTRAALGGYDPASVLSVLLEAHELVNEYGTRPYWSNLPFKKGEDVPASLAPDVVAHLIPCESLERDRDEIDSNGKMSRGILQFQDAFWADMSKASGITGSPDNPEDAVRMAEYAIENGYLDRWSCARILHALR